MINESYTKLIFLMDANQNTTFSIKFIGAYRLSFHVLQVRTTMLCQGSRMKHVFGLQKGK